MTDATHAFAEEVHRDRRPSSDGKKVVQALYHAIAAGDVERFFGAMHPQFQAELPGYLP